ncbi:MAG: hypothetical protein JXA89_26480 [Anaerolineae bacterium]|nr:hypothetical protein [Anaerolineae bacterium]
MIQDLPNEFNMDGLSRPIAEHTVGGKFSSIVGVLALFLVGALIFGLSIASLQGTLDPVWVDYGTGGLVLLVLASGVSWWLNRRARFLVFPEGLVHLAGRKIDVYRWEMVESVRQQHKLATNGRMRHRYTIRRKDGKSIVLTDRVPFVDALIAELEQGRLEYELPSLLRAYRAGGTLIFGALRLDSSGLRHGQMAIPVREIDGVRITWGHRGGAFEVKRQGHWQPLPEVNVENAPNLSLLVALLDKLAVQDGRDMAQTGLGDR